MTRILTKWIHIVCWHIWAILFGEISKQLRHRSQQPNWETYKKNFKHMYCLDAYLKMVFSANPSHRSLPFFFRTDHMDSPDCLLFLLSISVFTFSVLHFSVVGSVLTHVGFRAHIKIVSRIVSNRKVMFSPRSSTAAMRTLLNGLNSGFIASRRSKTIFLVTVNNAYSATLRCDKWLR